MTRQQLRDKIDLDITNKLAVKSISPLNVGENIKRVLDFYENTDVLPEGIVNLYFTEQRIKDVVTPLINNSIADISGKEDKNKKGIADGYTPLNSNTKVPSTYLDIVSDLVSGGTTSILSAEQGKQLNLLKQDVDNLSQSILTDKLNATKYPSTKEVYDFVKNELNTNLQKVITSDYILTNLDNNHTIFINNNNTNVVITIPTGLTSCFQVGFIQQGSGEVSFISSGITLYTPIGLKIKGINYNAFVEKVLDTEVFHLLGNLKV